MDLGARHEQFRRRSIGQRHLLGNRNLMKQLFLYWHKHVETKASTAEHKEQ